MHAQSPDSNPTTELNLSEIPGKPIELISIPQLIQPQSTYSRYEFRTRGGIKCRYDKETGLLENPSTGKWVQNLINRKASTETPSTLLHYQHPDVDRILGQITQDPYMLESIGYLLRVILIKEFLRKYYHNHHKNKWHKEPRMAWLSHEFTKRILGESKYQGILTKLIQYKIIKRYIRTSVKGKVFLYVLANPAYLKGYSLLPITFKRLEDKIHNYREWAKWHYDPLIQRVKLQVIDAAWEIAITRDQLKPIWTARYYTKYLPTHPCEPEEREAHYLKYMESMEDVLHIIKHWNAADEKDKEDFFSVDDFGHRLHHVFTYLPSEIRAFIKNRDGEYMDMTEYDVSCSQPVILTNILVKEHRFMPTAAGMDFVSLVCRQEIYEDLARRMIEARDEAIPETMLQELIHDDWETRIRKIRPFAKTEMLHMLYCWPGSKADKKFHLYYSDVAAVAKKMKLNEVDENNQYIRFNERVAQLPKKMQRMESEMSREVWRMLLNDGRSFMPIHDAVYVAGLRPAQKKKVQSEIEKVLADSISIPFKIKQENVRKKLKEWLDEFKNSSEAIEIL